MPDDRNRSPETHSSQPPEYQDHLGVGHQTTDAGVGVSRLYPLDLPTMDSGAEPISSTAQRDEAVALRLAAQIARRRDDDTPADGPTRHNKRLFSGR